MTRFEDNLWREVQRTYGSELSEADGPLHRGARLRAPVIAGTSLGVVGAGVAAAVILSAASSSPAFAVTQHKDGTVSVAIWRVAGIPGANARLAQLGVRARAVRVDNGCQVSASLARPLPHVAVATLTPDRRRVVVAKVMHWTRIRPTRIPLGRTLVIPAVRAGSRVQLVRARAVRGVVPACLPPFVQITPAVGGPSSVRVISCRGGIVLQHRPIAVSPGTNTTNTNTTNTNTTNTTATNTNATSTTNTTNWTNTNGTSTSPTGGSAPPIPQLPPPLLQACLRAAQSATR